MALTKKQLEFKKAIKLELKQEQVNTDYEVAHSNADEILCKLLHKLECQDIVDEFIKVGRWYG